MAVKSGAVQVEGLRELRAFLRKAPDKTATDGLKKIHSKVAEPVEQQARIEVPRRSGRLEASIRRAKGSTKAATVRAGGARVPYAGVIEFGWPNRQVVFGKPTQLPSPIREHAFLRTALAKRQEEVLDEYQRLLDDFLAMLMRQSNL